MKAVRFTGPQDLEVADIPAPQRDRRAGLVPLRVGAVGICGSDLHYYNEGQLGGARIAADFVPGHEFGGWLEADVPERGLAAGQLVAVDPQINCGVCELCQHGHPNLCPNVRFYGAPPVSGAMTERILVQPDQLYALPDSFTAADAAMLEPLGVAVHAGDLADFGIMADVAVIGCGPIGLLIQEVARAAGARRVLAVDPVADRRALAEKLGAEATLTSAAEIAEVTDRRGCDVVIEATDDPAGFEHGVTAARIGGRLVIVGAPNGDKYTLSAGPARRKGLTVKFSRRAGHVYPRAIDLVARGRVDIRTLVTAHLPLESAARAFRDQAERTGGAVKTVLEPGRNGPTNNDNPDNPK